MTPKPATKPQDAPPVDPTTISRAANRTFVIQPGERKKVPLWIALNSPSGGGKTKSALRLAAGAQKVVGGKVAVIDTENDRALHYIDWFEKGDGSVGGAYGYKFDHVHFDPPFGSLHYLAAILQAAKAGARVIVTDSGSHEHDGIGGLLEQHEAEIDAIQAEQQRRYGRSSDREQVSGAAWKQPKFDRRRMINELMQLGVILIWCFRAKPKQDFEAKGKERDLGIMPVSAADLIFEMTVSMLLPALSEGHPDWKPTKKGERSIVKRGPFKKLFERSRQVDEEMGTAMATWALGSAVPETSNAAKMGTATERAEIIKALGPLREKLQWNVDQSKAWRLAVFGEADVTKLTVQQLDDARSLLGLMLDGGEEAYAAELASYIELGRAKGSDLASRAAAEGAQP